MLNPNMLFICMFIMKAIMLDMLSNFNLSIRDRINIYLVYLKVNLLSLHFLLITTYLSYSSLRHCGRLLRMGWQRVDPKSLLLVVFPCVFVTFPYTVLGQVWYLIVSIPDFCLPLYFAVLSLFVVAPIMCRGFVFGPCLTHLTIASFLWGIDKQCRPRSDATGRGV